MNQELLNQLMREAEHQAQITGIVAIVLIAIFAVPLWMIAIKLWFWHEHQKPVWYESNSQSTDRKEPKI
jgi:hypothetical protein